MDVREFRERIGPEAVLHVAGQDYNVRQVIRFRFDDGGYYIKCFLSDGFVLADDLDENSFILVREVKTSFAPPFPEELEYDGNKFKFLYTAHALAEEIWGEVLFKKGESERFWDYQSDDGHYLSLGIVDSTKQRLDFYGKIISGDELSIR